MTNLEFNIKKLPTQRKDIWAKILNRGFS